MKLGKFILLAAFCFSALSANVTGQATLARGPYLQMATANTMTIRWRTSVATNSRVQFGTIQGSLSQTADDPNVTTEHEVRLTGLVAGTKYFYSVGSTSAILAGNNATHFFVTSPNLGQVAPYRIWILGDSGTANSNAQSVRNAYLSYTGSTYTNLLLMLGDNAYANGTDSEYQAAVFNMYPTVLRQTPLFPTIGNHDTASSTSPPSSLPYFQIFTLPTGAEAGGVASGTEKYYSFNYGNIHFICLDSMTSSRALGGAMLTWLQNDLSQNILPWVIAYWHHPPYSKGSHNSDTESHLVQMRTNVLPILESWGVDLVLAGHSHSYERSFLIDGHYGTSGTFTNSMKKNAGGGRENIDGAYRKSVLSPHLPHEGAVYAVAGSSGQTGGGSLNHPAMFISLNNLGSMVLDVSNARLDAKFLRENGTIADYFTVVKGSWTTPVPPAAPTSLTAAAGSSQINLSWTQNSANEDGFKIYRCQNAGCTNFTNIAQVGANITIFSDITAARGITYVYRVRAFNTAGNSGYTNTAQAVIPATGTAALSDNFDDGVRDVSKWNFGLLSRSSTYFDPVIPVLEQNGRLSIAPRASITGNHYRGYLSAAAWNLTNSTAGVEVVQKTTGKAVTIFSVGTNKDNWFSFRGKGSFLYLESRIAATTTSTTISYSAAQHRFWRFRHNIAADTINFETSADGIAWTTRRTVARQISIAVVKFELVAGTGESVASPGTALFDNFLLKAQ